MLELQLGRQYNKTFISLERKLANYHTNWEVIDTV